MNPTQHPISIAVLGGTGAEGSGLALRWAHAGHRVTLGSRNPDKARERTAELNGLLGRDALTWLPNEAATRAADVVVLTVPHAAQRATVEEVAQALDGKILVDATVPLVPPKVNRVQLPQQGSAVAAMQALLGPQVRVVSALQNVSAHHLKDLGHAIDCDVLVCGDDIEARRTVIGLVRDLGLRGVHAGPICNSAAAEALTSILISINMAYKVPGAGLRITGVPALEQT
jgi:NADPH-dependent F420 reductase